MADDANAALEFLNNVIESCTEYSIVATDLDGTIVLWNEGARRTFGYIPEEVVGNANFAVLHAPEDVSAGNPRRMMKAALTERRWMGKLECVRRNGERFTAFVVITPRIDSTESDAGYLIISNDISANSQVDEPMRPAT
jgi:PAS domain S-box-containing protein